MSAVASITYIMDNPRLATLAFFFLGRFNGPLLLRFAGFRCFLIAISHTIQRINPEQR